MVEGPHAAQPAAWTYDELRQDEQAIRPFLARDEIDRRHPGRPRLEQPALQGERRRVRGVHHGGLRRSDPSIPIENELPAAGGDPVRFRRARARAPRILAPDADAGEQVAFALAARDGKLATAGFVVRQNADGTKRTYPDPNGYVDYDGYIAIYDGDGKPLLHHDFNLGRGDVLAALRWLPDDIVAVGSSGWDRWQGGNSISRGADPLIAWMSPDGARAATRVIPLSDGARHFNLLDVMVTGRAPSSPTASPTPR